MSPLGRSAGPQYTNRWVSELLLFSRILRKTCRLSTISVSKQDGCAGTDESWGGRKMKQVSQYKVASEETNEYAGYHGDREERQAA